MKIRTWARSLPLAAAVVGALLAVASPASPASASDANGDGVADVGWYDRASGVVSMWEPNAGGTVVRKQDLDWTCRGACARTWKIIGFGDLNRDGVSDVFWYDATSGVVSVWEPNATGTVVRKQDLSFTCGDSCATTWHPIGVGDLNGDGVADLFWYDRVSGAVSVWEPNTSGVVVRAQSLSFTCTGACASTWQPVGVGDLNGDRVADLFWYDRRSGVVSAWEPNTIGVVVRTQALSSTCNGACAKAWKPVGLGDLNGDHVADLFWYDRVSGVVSAWEPNTGGSVVRTIDLDWTCAGVCATSYQLVGIAG